jgi:hypothetical protein
MWRAIEARAQSWSQNGAACLLRILTELDAHPLTVLGRGIQHQFFRRRLGGPATHQIQEPIASVHLVERAGAQDRWRETVWYRGWFWVFVRVQIGY